MVSKAPKIDSNITGLPFAVENAVGSLPASPRM